MSSADRSAADHPPPTATRPSRPAPCRWRTSSFSDRGNCVALARLDDGRVGVRNSNRPRAGTLAFPPAAVRAWIDASRAGELDDLS